MLADEEPRVKVLQQRRKVMHQERLQFLRGKQRLVARITGDMGAIAVMVVLSGGVMFWAGVNFPDGAYCYAESQICQWLRLREPKTIVQ